MINAIKGLFVFLAMIFCTWIIIFSLTELGVDASRKPSQTETSFKSACVAVNGNAVFNGKHWECLK